MTGLRVRLVAVALFLLSQSVHAADPVRVTPADPSPLARPMDLVERQFSPLEAFQIERKLRATGTDDILDVKDLSAERLLLRVPAQPAADGRYGLVVFIDSETEARYDREWGNPLDSHGVILVSPDNAGDDAPTLERRIPLVLDAYEYARRTYPLDPARVYIAGADGGARLAERLAIAYPEIFTGVVANAGAADLGSQELPAPTADGLLRLRTQSRLMFATARMDQPAFSEQRRILETLATYCVPVARVFENGHTIQGHAGISGRMLADVLREMEGPRGQVEPLRPDCENTLRQTATTELARIRQLHAGGDAAGALKALVAFDHAYGRLYFDDEIAVARELNPAFFDAPVAAAGAPAGSDH